MACYLILIIILHMADRPGVFGCCSSSNSRWRPGVGPAHLLYTAYSTLADAVDIAALHICMKGRSCNCPIENMS